MGLYQARVLSLLWAVAVVVSLHSSANWLRDLTHQWSSLVAFIAALWLLCKPTSHRLLQVSIVTYLILAVAIMPNIPNHRMVLVFAGIALLVGTLRRADSPKVLANLRWLTVIVYLFAALAKCNVDYLNSGTSCATLFLSESLKLHALRPLDAAAPTAGVSWAGWWSLLAEVGLVALLIPLKTRSLGVVAGIAFHLFLATHYIKYFANFSAVMLLLLSSWLSEEQCRKLVTKHLAPRNGILIAWAGLFAAVLIAHACGFISLGTWVLLRYAVWSVFAVFVLLVVTKSVRAASSAEGYSRLTAPSAVLISLALLNGISPYVGIKTRSGFSMYSNLRIEPGHSNHLVAPPSIDVFGYLSDTVRIVSTSDKTFAKLTPQSSERLPYISLCAYLARMDDGARELQSEVSYERNGEVTTRNRGQELPRDCPAWIARKLLLYGPVGDGAERSCIW